MQADTISRAAIARRARAGRRLPSASAAIAAGLVAGAVTLLFLEFFAVSVYDESLWQVLRMMAAMVRGPAALEPADEFDAAVVGLGLALHFSFAILYSLALASLVNDLPPAYAPLAGAIFGVALYYANFYGFANLFPWFITHRTVDTLAAHALFGALVAQGYWQFKRSADR